MDESAIIHLEDIYIDERLNYVEKPVAILDKKTKTLINNVISLLKVQGQHRKGLEWTWELVEEMRRNYQKNFS